MEIQSGMNREKNIQKKILINYFQKQIKKGEDTQPYQFMHREKQETGNQIRHLKGFYLLKEGIGEQIQKHQNNGTEMDKSELAINATKEKLDNVEDDLFAEKPDYEFI